ncbi:MAG: hypothetical protein B7Z82_01110 [Halothiobacillus sp. 20-54-6]|nr:MAG: hypothetical protein B7Z82_01110 [Halothiobacillus sp. 20-54-6]
MAESLFEQLKQAGLVDEQKAKRAKKDKGRDQYQQTKQHKGKAALSDAAELVARAAQHKVERDRQLNLAHQQQQAKKAAQAELRQIIESNRLSRYDGHAIYHFVDDNKVKTLHVSQEIHQRLVAARVRIARFEAGYVLIPHTAAEKIEQRDAGILIPITGVDASVSAEAQDYYTRFEVPDDLTW